VWLTWGKRNRRKEEKKQKNRKKKKEKKKRNKATSKYILSTEYPYQTFDPGEFFESSRGKASNHSIGPMPTNHVIQFEEVSH